MKCGYCGNGSGKTDARGNCVSCGACIDKPEPVTGSWVDVVGYTCSSSTYMDLGKWESSLPVTILKNYERAYLASTPQEELNAEDKYYLSYLSSLSSSYNKSVVQPMKYSVRWFYEAVFGGK